MLATMLVKVRLISALTSARLVKREKSTPVASDSFFVISSVRAGRVPDSRGERDRRANPPEGDASHPDDAGGGRPVARG